MWVLPLRLHALDDWLALIIFVNTPDETFTPTLSGAVSTHVYHTAKRAMADGHEVRVIARPHAVADPYSDVPSDLFAYPGEPSGLHLIARRLERKARGWTHVRFGEYARKLLETIRPYAEKDAAFVVHNDPEIVLWIRHRYPKVRLVHWFHNQHVCKERARKRFSDAVDRVVSVSRFTQSWVVPHYACDGEKCSVIHNGVDLDAFYPREHMPAGERPVINFTGRTGSEKGLDILLEAMLKLVGRGVAGFDAQVIGSNHWGARTQDAYQMELDGLVNQLAEGGVKVSMLGHLDRQATAEAMRQAQVHVVPSRWDEPFGLSTVEGMATGLATVVSRTGGSLEVIGDAGLSFDREDSDDLADLLHSLLADSEKRSRLGREARQRAELFSWDRTWIQMAEVVSVCR